MLVFAGCERLLDDREGRRVLYRSEGGAFQVLFPDTLGMPQEQTQEAESPFGTIVSHSVVAAGDHGYAMVAYTDYPPGALESIDTTATQGDILYPTATAAAEKIGFTLTVLYPSDTAGGPGLEGYGEGRLNGKAALMRGRYVFVGSRLYQVVFVSTDKWRFNLPDVDDLFQTFVVLESRR